MNVLESVGVCICLKERKNNKDLYNLNLFERERTRIKGSNKHFQHLFYSEEAQNCDKNNLLQQIWQSLY